MTSKAESILKNLIDLHKDFPELNTNAAKEHFINQSKCDAYFKCISPAPVTMVHKNI